jgi:hypothetical protein
MCKEAARIVFLEVALAISLAAIFSLKALAATPEVPGADARGPSTTAQNANFVVSAPTQDLADEMLARAEALRDEIAVTWLGAKLPPSVGPTVIRLTLSESEDKGLTWVGDRPDRLSHLMWLTTSRERALGSTLAHEMTHAVLATRYPGQIPAWCNEGIASQCDDEARIDARRQIVAWYAQTGNWPSLLETLAAKKIAPTDQSQYAVAASLAEFLLTQQDRAELLAFGLAGDKLGWDAAVRKHYGLASVRELETQWRAWAAKR